MAVYVDAPIWPYRRMMMCHMVADSLEELHAMADHIGVDRRWFQDGRVKHYDVCKNKRTLAINAGAIELDRRGIVNKMRELRGEPPRQKACVACDGAGYPIDDPNECLDCRGTGALNEEAVLALGQWTLTIPSALLCMFTELKRQALERNNQGLADWYRDRESELTQLYNNAGVK